MVQNEVADHLIERVARRLGGAGRLALEPGEPQGLDHEPARIDEAKDHDDRLDGARMNRSIVRGDEPMRERDREGESACRASRDGEKDEIAREIGLERGEEEKGAGGAGRQAETGD